jgi:CRP-like cAMP-binding protein
VAERRDRAPVHGRRVALSHSPNRLLASLPRAVFSAIKPDLRLVELGHGDVLAEAGGPIRGVHFPHSGIISLVVELSDGDMIETATVGRDGVIGAASALDGRFSFNKGIVRLAGVASVMYVEQLRALTDENKRFRSLLIRHEQVLFAQAQQSAACNASHSAEARTCRWLLRVRDLGGEQLKLSQELLGQMMGVRRSTVSLVASTLQRGGLIKCRRGNIEILDVEGLRKAACECYATVAAHYQKLWDR